MLKRLEIWKEGIRLYQNVPDCSILTKLWNNKNKKIQRCRSASSLSSRLKMLTKTYPTDPKLYFKCNYFTSRTYSYLETLHRFRRLKYLTFVALVCVQVLLRKWESYRTKRLSTYVCTKRQAPKFFYFKAKYTETSIK